MGINSRKYTLGTFICALLLIAATASLYAGNYNEPRKVLSSVYKNALYKNLTVPGEMKLDTKDDRIFLMEIGKRPTYFWNSDNIFHLFQTQKLNLKNIKYDNSESNNFVIDKINIPNGIFMSEGDLFFNKLELSNSYAGIIAGQSNTINMALDFKNTGNIAVQFNANNMNLNETTEVSPGNILTINNLRTRDLQANRVNFISPRMTIVNKGGVFSAKGTAINFYPASFEKSGLLKGFYGDWEVYSPDGSLATCGNLEDDDHETCIKVQLKGPFSKGDGVSLPADSIPIFDTADQSFTCVGEIIPERPENAGPYDPNPAYYKKGYCYDYVIAGNQAKYNYPQDPYEFKVQEIFRIPKTGDPVLIEQTPKFKTKGGQLSEISQQIEKEGVWSIFENGSLSSSVFWVNENNIGSISSIDIVSTSEARPCLIMCKDSNGFCNSNRLYIRNNRQLYYIHDGTVESSHTTNWPVPSEQSVNMLAVVEYTVGVCPAVTSALSTQYSNYEGNYDAQMMNGLLIPKGGDLVAPEVCLRRKVICNKSGETGAIRNYRPLSTDY